jgi:catechol 2,3-dioxygenase-like lactoylglutathione lyase family enzyme
MLSQLETYAVLPARDLQRARDFYKDKLGMEPDQDRPEGLVYHTPAGAPVLIYETENAGTAQNTAMGWTTNDFDSEVAELRRKGIVFEDFDVPGTKTENGIATTPDGRAAWFRDTEGNILCVAEESILE